MNTLAWLEKRFGRFAVPNVTVMIIIGQAVAFLVIMSQRQGAGVPPLLANIVLQPSAVLEGEVWRLFTFLLQPPSLSLLFAVIGWWVFYLMGTALESTWGTFRYNAFLLIGYLATVAAAFIQPNEVMTNVFFLGSVLLAFARLFPDFVFHLFFILPIKVKWLALIQWLTYGFLLVREPLPVKLAIVAAVLNYVVFFWREHLRDFKDQKRRREFQAKVQPHAKKGRLVHTCAVCGRSSEDEPRTAFRYCSQCSGQTCYCPEHIRDHEHVAEEATPTR